MGELIQFFGAVYADSTPIRGLKVVLMINSTVQKEAETDINGQFVFESFFSQPGSYYAYVEAYVPAELAEKFAKLGDINLDGIIDDKDANLLKEAYTSTPGSPKWNPKCDLNGDGRVDYRDLFIISRNYGLTMEEWLKRR
jgi:hypothetical protein